jgi:hypothetical protein
MARLTGAGTRLRYCRKQIGKKVRLRLTPEIRFLLDDSYIRGTRVSVPSRALHPAVPPPTHCIIQPSESIAELMYPRSLPA